MHCMHVDVDSGHRLIICQSQLNSYYMENMIDWLQWTYNAVCLMLTALLLTNRELSNAYWIIDMINSSDLTISAFWND